MPDTKQKDNPEWTPGDLTPDLVKFAELFADLTPQERAQVRQFMISLCHELSA